MHARTAIPYPRKSLTTIRVERALMSSDRAAPIPLTHKDICSMCQEATSYDSTLRKRSCKSCSAYWPELFSHFPSHGFWDRAVPQCQETCSPSPENGESWRCVLGENHSNGYHRDRDDTTW